MFVQTCAAEKRRRRKRGLMEDPARRVHDQSRGLRRLRRLLGAVELHLGRATGNRVRPQAHHQPVDLQQGLFLREGLLPVLRHRRGRQACASARLPISAIIGDLPEPASMPSLDRPYNIAVGGVGGTGVLTIGALLGMAAHIEGKASMILDMSGLAQKGGAVLSHVRLSQNTAEVTCSRIVTGTADLLLAADEVVAVAKETITLCESQRTHGVINTHLIPIADFIRNRDFDFQRGKVNHVLENSLRKDSTFFDFTKPAEALLGDSIATNMMMMGYAYQKGLLPLSAEAIEQAIKVNGVSIKMNTQAFRLGRLAAADPGAACGDDEGRGEPARRRRWTRCRSTRSSRIAART